VTRAALLVVVLALVAPAAAHAELVASRVDSAGLALAPDGSPRVAYVVGTSLLVATRSSAGVWTSQRVARLPGSGGSIAGIVVARSGRVAVLAEASTGRWLVLYERLGTTKRLTSLLPRLAAGARIGRAGLALDRRGLPVAAYAEWRPSRRTFLRLVRFARGRYRAAAVTRLGFPPSDIPPAAAPVTLSNGTIRVVEAYGSRGSAAIDWMPQRRDWLGQFLYTSPLAALAGPIVAAAGAGGVYAAWTVGFPTLGRLAVVVAQHSTPVRSELALEDAVLAGLVLSPAGPVVAGTAIVGGDLPAALVRGADGSTLELDGTAAAIAPGPQVLLARDAGLEWYAVPPAPPHVTLTVSPTPGAVELTGSVAGASVGSVTIYRERPGEARVAIASAPLAADGSFGPVTDVPGAPAFYRAVCTEPSTGLPVASLLRSEAAPR
jgi:hypothetical protein